MTDDPIETPRRGLVQGGLGGPEGELLEDGQEEVFSRQEVERGRIEHHTDAGGDGEVEGEDGVGAPVRAP